MSRHCGYDHRTRSDSAVVTDRDRSQHRCTRTDNDPILDRRMALFFPQARPTQGHALIDRHIVSDLGRFADNDSHAMIDEESTANLGPRMDLDPGKKAADIAHEPRDSFEPTEPRGIGHSIKKQRMKAWIRKKNFPDIPRRRIAVEYHLDVFF